ncbi:hypothetical protein GCM10023082_16310 [Streptomyces tremellae]|uniref:Uncharacterized protein n=1 Tax=Streptomyces tremellae TaxID=1124239 RepID=A0ABP7ENH8_9ACTN
MSGGRGPVLRGRGVRHEECAPGPPGVHRAPWDCGAKLTRSAHTRVIRTGGSHSGNSLRALPVGAFGGLLLGGAPVVHGCVE